MSDEITIRYVEPNDFMDMWRLQHKHHFHKKGLYSKEVFAFICKYCPDSQVAVMNGKIVGYHIAVMRWNEGHLDSMDMVFEPRGHFGLGLFYEHLEKSNYPRWTGGVSEDNENMFKSARDRWRTKEGKKFERTPWNDTYFKHTGKKRTAWELDFWGKMFDKIRKGGRVVECTGLENQQGGDSFEGSNPSSSASDKPWRFVTTADYEESNQ